MFMLITEVYRPEICVPDVIFARSDRGRAEEKQAAAAEFPVPTSARGGRNLTVRGSSLVKGIVDSARVRDPCRCCCQASVLSTGLLTRGAAVERRSGIRIVIGLAGRLGLPVVVRIPRLWTVRNGRGR